MKDFFEFRIWVKQHFLCFIINSVFKTKIKKKKIQIFFKTFSTMENTFNTEDGSLWWQHKTFWPPAVRNSISWDCLKLSTMNILTGRVTSSKRNTAMRHMDGLVMVLQCKFLDQWKYVTCSSYEKLRKGPVQSQS